MATLRSLGDISREVFLRNLQDSGLLTEDELAKHHEALPRSDDGAAVVRRFVDSQILTAYQAEAVTGRRFELLAVGNYEILSKLGAGGMGAVFKARHRRMKRIVAIKILSPEVARQGSFVKRFQREVETIAQLAHPNIVMAYDADEAEAGHFLVMEFVNGRDLASEVQTSGPMSVAAAVDCVAQAATGLEFAHAKGIIHRDIKPANLMLAADGVVKVADLGLARLNAGLSAEGDSKDPSLTQAGGILGTIDYMPPEQALDSTSIDQRADIYSLGCTLYFLLTGRPPYAAGSLMGLMLQHREAKIPDLRAARPDVPLAVVAVFERMVAKSPAERPAGMADVMRSLAALKPQVKGLTDRPAPESAPAPAPSNSDATMDVASGSSLMSDAPEVPSRSLPAVAGPRATSDLVLVLVEPSRTQSAIVRNYLTSLGVGRVHPTGSGAQAVAMVKEHAAHAILSSMHLADMTGVQLADALRAEPACDAVGFVLTSSEADTTLAGAVLGHPKTELLMKPYGLSQLSAALAAATGRPPDSFKPPA